MARNLYRGVFMYNRECVIRYGYACTDKQARFVLITRLAKELGIDPRVVFGHFKDHPDKVTISVEMEVKEDG
jgi:hypothetical protein